MRRDEKYIAWARNGAQLFSTCDRRQFMAIIVDSSGRIIGTGVQNGSPPGMAHCIDGACPHLADPHGLSSADVNGRPCMDCAKKIAGSGIARVVCTDDGVGTGISFLRSAGVEVTLVP